MTRSQALVDAASIKKLRHLIASVISDQKAYNVPRVCVRYGLASGTNEEAFQSKFKYVIQRVESLSADEVLRVARALQADEGNTELDEALAKIDEKNGPLITPLTRRRIVAELDHVPLSGDLPEIDFLKKLWPIDAMRSPNPTFDEPQMEDFLFRHRVRNDDLSNKEVLEYLGIYTCSQKQFFRLLEAMLDPLTREIPEQADLAARLTRHLAHDGFRIDESGKMSGSPIYKVRHIGKGGSTPADSEISKALLAFNPHEIHARWQKALERRATDPRAAITSARTLLEDTCKWILHEADEPFKDEDDLPVLYKRLAKVLKLAPDDHTEQVFKQILGSCQSIVESLGAIRNKLGDAHSQGPKRARPQTRHAELAVNLAGTMATFLIATWNMRQQNSEAAKAPPPQDRAPSP
ncbi:abortive infection family protein [Methylocystis iwaonis]|uniref:abortive infection family protein n=1 Tax=Methylocystis iwaonis TaxID=2885079 RepID=UPI002E7BF15D|nr:abortive infection family protein [Methylocystis iwaonis]